MKQIKAILWDNDGVLVDAGEIGDVGWSGRELTLEDRKMKKYLIMIICILVGIFIGFHLPYRETKNASEEKAPNVQITLEDYIEDHLGWSSITKLLTSLAEIGCVDGEINGFYWDTEPFHFHTGSTPRYEALDQIVMHYKFKDHDEWRNRPPMPAPQEQYDLECVHDWCKRNQNKYAEITFGSLVRFNVIREITTMLHNHNIKFALAFPDDDYGRRSVEIKLWQPERPMRVFSQEAEPPE